MDRDHCLILTNLEYANDPSTDPLEKRTFARNFRQSVTRIDAFIRASLVDAEYHSAEGQGLIDDQRAHVAELTRQGNDARNAQHLLVQFEAARELLNTDRDRLRRLVANIELDWPQSAA